MHNLCLSSVSFNVGHLAPEKTDFGIRISGDSMEPMYHTGDVAWVHKQDSISNGEIGIFCLNNRLLSCSC
nr:S24 family peptidase [Dorea sp. AGR2135]